VLWWGCSQCGQNKIRTAWGRRLASRPIIPPHRKVIVCLLPVLLPFFFSRSHIRYLLAILAQALVNIWFSSRVATSGSDGIRSFPSLSQESLLIFVNNELGQNPTLFASNLRHGPVIIFSAKDIDSVFLFHSFNISHSIKLFQVIGQSSTASHPVECEAVKRYLTIAPTKIR
jgi:hypothetical protein